MKTKKLWAALMALVMAISLLPAAALAADNGVSCPGGPGCTHEAEYNGKHYPTIGGAIAAANSGSGGTVKLLKSTELQISGACQYILKNMTLDLNEKTLQCNAYIGFKINPGVKFTIQNGVFENISTNQWATAIEASKQGDINGTGCTITVKENATIKANYSGVYAVGYTEVYVYNSKIESKYPVYGAGPANEVTLDGATITGSVYGVYQGPYDPYYFEHQNIKGSKYKIYDSTITGTYAGIFINNYLGDVAKENHTLLVDNSSVTGGSGIETKRTDVTIQGDETEIIATGTQNMNPDGSPVSSGYALAVTYYSEENVVSDHRNTKAEDYAAGTLSITGGTFAGAIGIQGPKSGEETEATLTITGGAFSSAPDTGYLGGGSYLVTVNSDNGDPVTNTVVSGSFTLPAAPIKADSVFLGWLSSADNQVYEAEKSVSISENTTFTAQWVPSHYTVTFNSNGGTGSMTAQEFTYNTPQAIRSNEFTKTGYTFAGWNTAADGTGTPYGDRGELTLTDNLTLYAQWEINHYTVTFHSNGGSAVAAQTVAYNQKAAEPSPAPVRTGYAFLGWYADKNCTQAYDFNTPVTGNLTLYAGWEIIVIPVPGHAISIVTDGNGTVTTTPVRAEAGETVTINVTPNAGYEVADITVTAVTGETIAVSGNRFTMPSASVTVKVTFVRTSSPFFDVTAGDWFYEEVLWAYENNVMDGVGGGKFAPNSSVSRAMVWTVLARIDGKVISGSDWADEARAWAMAEGVSDGTMATGNVTREQLATMLYRFAKYKGIDVSIGGDTNILSYSDADQVSDWAVEAMQWACGTGIINGMDGKLNPQGGATRAQLATMLMRFVAVK